MLHTLSYRVGHILVASARGAMLFFGAVIAPLVFKHLPAYTSGPFIRRVFPVYDLGSARFVVSSRWRCCLRLTLALLPALLPVFG